jgi:hypothetical protein
MKSFIKLTLYISGLIPKDESGFEGDPRPRNRWDKKGSKTRVTQNGGHLRMNVIGEEQLLERLDQAILDVINNPKKTQKTARIGTLI